ncbi:MAG: GH42 [uncultured Chloroflexia bacterium]|uniref:beta-galactosidase n=1 Tax=uncultured Chloroflexia bacterium TaxID=1672391 RepID=A0A6J4K4G9_9CHLR|nr:MAG: GH42 [uncultured Chloroflexia bacterium]
MNENGVRLTYGLRRAYCPSHPLYHALSRRIVTRLAEHYAERPEIVGWQIDNEFGDRCYCDICRAGFQAWLQEKYGSLDALNDAWGTVFWSHTYNDWLEVPVPLTTGGPHNPGLALDFKRFASDVYVTYQKMQIDILREHCPKDFITHNLMGFGYDQLDYFEFAKDLDFVSWDNYPRGFWDIKEHVNPSAMALSHATMRGLKRQNFWMMEQQTGPGGWDIVSVTPRPGELRLWAYQAIAHGADGMIFFRWRTARFGTEEYWHGILNHDGTPGRRYEEIKKMGLELKRMGDDVLASEVEAEVAMLLSYDARFAFQVQANNPKFSYPGHFATLYEAFHSLNVPVDIVPPDADLSSYKLVIAPALYVLDETLAERLKAFTGAGGTFLTTLRSGVKDEANAVVNMPLPGLLAELCGITIEDYDSLPEGGGQGLEFTSGFTPASEARADIWCDILVPQSAEVVACYTANYYAGEASVTLNRVGRGQAVYVGTAGNRALYDTLAPWLLNLAGVSLCFENDGLEITERSRGDTRLRFVLNHSEEERRVSAHGYDLLTDKAVEGEVSLAPKGVMVLKIEAV